MARPRIPKAKAKVEARDKKDPQRFKNRKEPKVDGSLGEPPPWLVDTKSNKARQAWLAISRDIPWLNNSHRSLVAIAASVYGRMMAGEECGVQALNLLRQCLGSMGATPSDASKVTLPDDDEEADDILD